MVQEKGYMPPEGLIREPDRDTGSGQINQPNKMSGEKTGRHTPWLIGALASLVLHTGLQKAEESAHDGEIATASEVARWFFVNSKTGALELKAAPSVQELSTALGALVEQFGSIEKLPRTKIDLGILLVRKLQAEGKINETETEALMKAIREKRAELEQTAKSSNPLEAVHRFIQGFQYNPEKSGLQNFFLNHTGDCRAVAEAFVVVLGSSNIPFEETWWKFYGADEVGISHVDVVFKINGRYYTFDTASNTLKPTDLAPPDGTVAVVDPKEAIIGEIIGKSPEIRVIGKDSVETVPASGPRLAFTQEHSTMDGIGNLVYQSGKGPTASVPGGVPKINPNPPPPRSLMAAIEQIKISSPQTAADLERSLRMASSYGNGQEADHITFYERNYNESYAGEAAALQVKLQGIVSGAKLAGKSDQRIQEELVDALKEAEKELKDGGKIINKLFTLQNRPELKSALESLAFESFRENIEKGVLVADYPIDLDSSPEAQALITRAKQAGTEFSFVNFSILKTKKPGDYFMGLKRSADFFQVVLQLEKSELDYQSLFDNISFDIDRVYMYVNTSSYLHWENFAKAFSSFKQKVGKLFLYNFTPEVSSPVVKKQKKDGNGLSLFEPRLGSCDSVDYRSHDVTLLISKLSKYADDMPGLRKIIKCFAEAYLSLHEKGDYEPELAVFKEYFDICSTEEVNIRISLAAYDGVSPSKFYQILRLVSALPGWFKLEYNLPEGESMDTMPADIKKALEKAKEEGAEVKFFPR